MSHHRPARRRHRWKLALVAGAGAAVVIGGLAKLQSEGLPLLLGSFGASLVIMLGFPDSGFSKPGRVIGAHVLGAVLGLLALHGLGDHWWAEALAVGACIALMLGLRLVHPPAGSNPLIIFAIKAKWSFLLYPTLAGSVTLVLMAAAWRRWLMEESPHEMAHHVRPTP